MWTLLFSACDPSGDTAHAPDSVADSRPSGDTDAGDTDTGDTDAGDTDTGDTDTGDTDSGGSDPPPDAGRRWLGEYTADADADAIVWDVAGSWLGAGDLDGDGLPDLATAEPGGDVAWVFGGFGPGASLTSADAVATVTITSGDGYGYSGAVPGDVTGDAATDLVLGRLDGGAWIMTGPLPAASVDADAFATLDTGTVFAGLASDGAAGLVVGDAAADVAWLLAGPLAAGAHTVATEAVATLGAAAGGYFGSDLADAGDLDGDGVHDLIVSGPSAEVTGTAWGAAFVFLGPVAGTLDAETDADTIVAPTATRITGALGHAADLDGDGHGDLVVGAAGALVYAGPVAAGTLSEADASAVVRTDCTSRDLDASTDLDGDGHDDLTLGCPSWSRNSTAYLYYAPLAGSLGTADADATFYDSGYYDAFGAVVTALGDVDGDGLEDLGFADDDQGGGGRAIYTFFGGL